MSDQPFWKRYGGSAPENYERYFVPAIGAPLAKDLIEVAALRPGERVLDVACGTGVVTRMAAERVGADGVVAGLDLNPGMLAVARAVAPPDVPIAWHEASAESMPLPDESFDVVLCGLSLQFVPDKAKALREMHRVLKPGGRLILNTPGPTPRVFALADEAMSHHVPQAAGFVSAVFSLDSPGELETLIGSAGFRDVVARPVMKTLRLPAPAEFLWQYVQSTPLSAMFAQVDDARRAALERDVVTKWEEFVKDGALTLQQGVVLATARK